MSGTDSSSNVTRSPSGRVRGAAEQDLDAWAERVLTTVNLEDVFGQKPLVRHRPASGPQTPPLTAAHAPTSGSTKSKSKDLQSPAPFAPSTSDAMRFPVPVA